MAMSSSFPNYRYDSDSSDPYHALVKPSGPWKSGRWESSLSSLFGALRLHTPFLIVWVLGLAGLGEYSLTYNLFAFPYRRSKTFRNELQPLAYPMYLVHYPCVWYYWFATRGVPPLSERWTPSWERAEYGYGKYWWFTQAAGYPWPVTTIELVPIYLFIIGAAWLLNRISGWSVGVGMVCVACQCRVCGGCWSWMCGGGDLDCCPEGGHDHGGQLHLHHDGHDVTMGQEGTTDEGRVGRVGQEGTTTDEGRVGRVVVGGAPTTGPRPVVGPVVRSIIPEHSSSVEHELVSLCRSLSGAVLTRDSRIEEIGVDSLGAATVAGSIRRRFVAKDGNNYHEIELTGLVRALQAEGATIRSVAGFIVEGRGGSGSSWGSRRNIPPPGVREVGDIGGSAGGGRVSYAPE